MPQNRVIIFVSDDNYIDQVKSLAVNCVEQGKYEGDFAVICPLNSIASDQFRKAGFYVAETETDSFFRKFFVFDTFFKIWEQALYLDCDILVQRDLSDLFHLLEIDDSKIWMDTEDGTTMESFWRDPNKDANTPIYEWMVENYPTVNKQTFNSAFILFNPKIIPAFTPNKLIEIQNRVEPTNRLENGGTDQQVINLLLWDLCKKIPDKLVCFWGLAEPINDVDSEWRQFKKGDIPVAIHYTRWYSPWTRKTPDADAYLLRLLDVPCFDLYQENLSKFNKIFNNATTNYT